MSLDAIILEKRLIRALVDENFKEADRFFSSLLMIHPAFTHLGRNGQERVLYEARRYFRCEIQQYNNKFYIDSEFIENMRHIIREIIDSIGEIRKGRWHSPYDHYDPKLDVIFGPMLFFVLDDYDDDDDDDFDDDDDDDFDDDYDDDYDDEDDYDEEEEDDDYDDGEW